MLQLDSKLVVVDESLVELHFEVVENADLSEERWVVADLVALMTVEAVAEAWGTLKLLVLICC